MGFSRWFFYGTKSWSDKNRKLDIDKGEPKGKVAKHVMKSEDRAAARRAARQNRPKKKGFFYWE